MSTENAKTWQCRYPMEAHYIDPLEAVDRLEDELRDKAAALDAALKALKAVEWEGIAYEHDDSVAGCVSCGNSAYIGHSLNPRCELKAAIAQAESAQGPQ
jgi:hypothetical protein